MHDYTRSGDIEFDDSDIKVKMMLVIINVMSSASSSKAFHLVWTFALALVIIFVVPVHGIIATCIASNVLEGENANVSCHFDKDINVVKQDVLINVYKNNQRNPVLVLSWTEGRAESRVSPGYLFNGIISDHIVINIPNATRDKSGLYKCIVVPSKEADVQPCTLTIKGKDVDPYDHKYISSDNFTTVSEMTSESIFITRSSTDYGYIKESRTEKEVDGSTIAIIVLGLSLGVVIVVLVTILLVAWKKHMICRGKARTNSHTHQTNDCESHPQQVQMHLLTQANNENTPTQCEPNERQSLVSNGHCEHRTKVIDQAPTNNPD